MIIIQFMSYGTSKNTDALCFIIQDENGDSLTDLEIRDECDVILFAGHDTTSSATSWGLYNLAKFPEHQEKCYEEVRQLLQSKERGDLEW